jgi:hypothetical protein
MCFRTCSWLKISNPGDRVNNHVRARKTARASHQLTLLYLDSVAYALLTINISGIKVFIVLDCSVLPSVKDLLHSTEMRCVNMPHTVCYSLGQWTVVLTFFIWRCLPLQPRPWYIGAGSVQDRVFSTKAIPQVTVLLPGDQGDQFPWTGLKKGTVKLI